jgi:DNA-binding response OmpR family regulator
MSASILVVDDEVHIRRTIVRAMQRVGYHVTDAADGEHALAMLSPPPTNSDAPGYDLILTDIVMGAVDGIQVMHAARRLTDPPEVILLTGHGTLETAIAAVREGAFDYLLKPYRIDRLLKRVAEALEYRQARRRQVEDSRMLHKVAEFVSRVQPPATAIPPQPSDPPAPDDVSHLHAAEDPERYLGTGLLCIDTHRCEVTFNGQAVHVTPTEYKLLVCLAEAAGRVVTFSELARSTHNQDLDEADAHELLSWHVRNLRQKLDRRYLVSVRGTGYLLMKPYEPESVDGDGAG